MRDDVLGRCGACGGVVMVYETWPRCAACGAWAASADLPIVPMVRERPPAPDRPAPFYKGLRVLEPPEAGARCGPEKAPVGWYCTRDQNHDGPCALELVTHVEQRANRGCYIDSAGFERIVETGFINNCAARAGESVASCQMCQGPCPDRDKLIDAMFKRPSE